MAILVIAEHDNHSLRGATRHSVAAAGELGGDIHLLVAGQGCEAAARSGQSIARVGLVKWAELDNPSAENLANLVVGLSSSYTHVVAAATTYGKDWLPRVAAKLGVAQISDVVRIESPDTFVRPIYAGSLWTRVRSLDSLRILTVRITAFEPVAEAEGMAPLEALPPDHAMGHSKRISQELHASERPELESARVVVSGGRGLGSADHFRELLEPLADQLNAALGASRAAVDLGYVPNDYQVGQTGKTVAPELYIAVGISGAIQHLAGMKDSKVIVAINKDAEAPIFQVADYGLVGDLSQVVPALTQAIASTS